MRCQLLFLAIALLLSGGAPQATMSSAGDPPEPKHTASKPVADRAADVTEIYEAVFRHEFQHYGWDRQPKGKCYFLSIDNKDPDRDFLRRFARDRLLVDGASKFKDNKGALFHVDSVKWLDDDTVEVKGRGPLCSGASVLRLARKAGQWSVVEDQAMDIYETVFRHQFQHNHSAAQQKAANYFLLISKSDPTTGFLRRFADNRPPVDVGSKFKVGNGVRFRIESLKWLDENTVELTGGYYEGPLSSSGNVYRVIRKDRKWSVEEDKLEWIS